MTTHADRTAAAQLQIAARQTVLAVARQDHWHEIGNRVLNLCYAHLGCLATGIDFDQVEAAIGAGVSAALRELSAGPASGGRG